MIMHHPWTQVQKIGHVWERILMRWFWGEHNCMNEIGLFLRTVDELHPEHVLSSCKRTAKLRAQHNRGLWDAIVVLHPICDNPGPPF